MKDELLSPDDWGDETIDIDHASPIGQGDVLVFSNPESVWDRVGIVVSANCDLYQEKTGGVVSWVPLLPLADYWRLVLLPTRARVLISKVIFPNLVSSIRSLHKSVRLESSVELSDPAIIDLVLKDNFEDLLRKISGSDSIDEKILLLADSYRSASKFQTYSFSEAVLRHANIKTASSGKKCSEAQVIDELKSGISSLPGDAFFIGSVRGCGKLGYVAYLRLVRTVSVGEIAVRFRSQRTDDFVGSRVSRLASPYVYRLTQQLGQVFSDIGLPEHYENRRGQIAKRFLP